MKMEKKDMNIQSSRSSPALISGTDELEKILHHLKNTRSHVIGRDDVPNTDTLGRLSNQVRVLENTGKPRNFVTHSRYA